MDLFAISDFDEAALARMLADYQGIVTLEEGFRARGGVDALLLDFFNRSGGKAKLRNIGVDPGYRFELGSRAELHEQVSIGVNAVIAQVRDFARGLDMGVNIDTIN